MDWAKDIFTAYNQRIKSPILGSIILAFIAWNWQPIFYVIFADNSAIQKFVYFDANVLHWRDYWIPFFIGVILAFAMPFIAMVGAFVSAWPTNQLRSLIERQAHKVAKEKAEAAHNLSLKNAERQEELAWHGEAFVKARIFEKRASAGPFDMTQKEITGAAGTLVENSIVEQSDGIDNDVNLRLSDINKKIALLEKETGEYKRLTDASDVQSEYQNYIDAYVSTKAEIGKLKVKRVGLNSEIDRNN